MGQDWFGWGSGSGESWSNNGDWNQTPGALRAADAQAAGVQIVGHIDTPTESNLAVYAKQESPVDDGQSEASEITFVRQLCWLDAFSLLPG